MKIAELKEKKVAILGLGVEGLATAEYFLKHKIAFAVLDEKDGKTLKEISPEWKTVVEKLEKKEVPLLLKQPLVIDVLKQFDVIIRSPGISPLKEALIQAQELGIKITSQTQLFFDNCPCPIIGVTGTKGKGTTSSLIYEMLRKSGIDAYLGGNIGLPPFSFLDSLTTDSKVVLEMSSFQLQDLKTSPHISVMLMVTSEHLDYHSSTEEYVNAKRNILRWQTADDMAVLNTDYPATRDSQTMTKGQVAFVSRYAPVGTGCFVENNEVALRYKGNEERVISVNDILLPGAHNHENVCAAVMASYMAGVSLDDIRFVLRTFKGLEHRLELVREVSGVRYYDDSFSTVPETAIAAIEAFTAPEILILGGSSKNSDFSELGLTIRNANNVKAIIGIGVEWKRIKESIKNHESSIRVIEGLKTMGDIVRAAAELAEPGDVVLLSPACASFDMFKNYKDRGNQFKQEVKLL